MSFNNIHAVEHAANQELTHRVNVEKGWFDKPVSFLEAMALLVTEVSEASDAYREEGLLGGWQAREHLASELADIYIRLLDDCSRFHVDLGLATDSWREVFFQSRADSFDGRTMTLVWHICQLIETWRKVGEEGVANKHPDIARGFAYVYLSLEMVCDEYGVDLMKAFAAKTEKNRQRPYRHGDKHA